MATYRDYIIFRFESEVAHKDTTITIQKKDFPSYGTPKYRKLGAAPVLRREQREHIHGASLQLFAQADIEGEFAELGGSDATAFLVTVVRGTTTIFKGFLTPELYSEPDIPVPYDVELNATDGLGELKYKTYEEVVGSSDQTLKQILTKLINAAGVTYDTTELFGEFFTIQSGSTSIGNFYINFGNRAEDKAYDVLSDILASLNAELFIDGLKARLLRLNDITPDSQLDYGEYLSVKWGVHHYWPVGNLISTLIAARKQVKVANDCEVIRIPFSYPSYNKFTAPYAPKVDVDLVVSGYKRSYSAGTPQLKVAMYYAVGQALYLTEAGGLSNSEVWGPTVQITGTSADDPSETTVRLPLVFAAQYAGRELTAIEVTTKGAYADDFTMAMEAVTLKGYKDTIKIANGARNDASDVTSIITRATSSMSPDAWRLMYGLPHTSAGGQPTTWTSTRHRSDARDFLSFLAWDYAYYNAVAKISKDGKVNTPDDRLPLFLLEGDYQEGTYYFLHTYSWDLLADEAEIKAESIVEATLSGVTETITENKK